MSWQLAALSILVLVVAGGFAWYERSRPPARIIAVVAALAALGVAGRVALAPFPNVVATTDVALLAGYTLGGGPGFAVGALSGLVSNFWLGQGPWTPWQMAGWGLVGLFGAALATLSGRRLGRWGLAGVGAFAGLAYGALLDLSVMVSYGGEQSLDRYLALSARGIPFNIAHAAGNAALMLAAGPAMVRMLDRYRDRFEVKWRDAPLGRAAVAIAAALCLGLPLLAPNDADAKASDATLAKRWLVAAQNDDGGFGTAPGEASSSGMTGWAMLGLEAAGVNPRDVTGGGNTPVEYLRDNASAVTSTADLERTILALDGAGIDPRQFAGDDLVARLRDRQSRDGSFEHQVNLTSFAILAQRAAGVEGSNLGKAAAWLRSIQNRNAGWGSVAEAESEADSTGAVLQALAVAPGDDAPIADGAHWLERTQRGDGGWSLTPGAASNSQSTAWAIQGVIAARRNPGAIRNDGTSGIDYLARRRAPNGHYTYSTSSDQTPVWVTAQGLTAVGREPFPIPAVARVEVDEGAGDGTASDGDTGDPGAAPVDLGSALGGSTDSFDGEGLGFPGASGDGGGAGGGSGGSAGGGPPEPGGEPGPRTNQGLPLEGLEAASSAALTEATPTAFVATDRDGSPLPATAVLLSGLAVLAIGLAAGFLWYRRRLP